MLRRLGMAREGLGSVRLWDGKYTLPPALHPSKGGSGKVWGVDSKQFMGDTTRGKGLDPVS